MDENRAEDGTDLRYRFGEAYRYKDAEVAANLDDRPCSVLEMMVALAIRCEEHIMDDPAVGDRTGRWFWDMVDNLGLGAMSDARYEEEYIDAVLERFLNRKYDRDGAGGLFTVKRCPHDLRSVDIWYQMCWHLDDVIQGE